MKLKFLCYDNTVIDHQSMKEMMPKLQINSVSGKTRIAGPCQPEYNYRNWVIKPKNNEDGLWEINAEREKLFPDNFNFRQI